MYVFSYGHLFLATDNKSICRTLGIKDIYVFFKGRNDYSINMITKELRYLTWEEAFLSLRSDILPEAIRAKYCDLTTSMYKASILLSLMQLLLL